ncbi:DUF819 domain-containing protein [Parahaliea mediterranea]|uniref:DUF819 family protein n=1 Tax=Parahaliea mediterranea TaxID=651086 RepID=A0A939IHC8_9GAMM|nr:DUF819 family protein [Parahaliea mediterranea]MBN7795269.1 DUF819 family protein [Parahaliea mediterranea]
MTPPDNMLALCAVLFGLAWLGFWLDTNAIGKRTSGVVWVLAGAMLLSNTGLIPLEHAVYNFIHASLVPLAIPLLLMKADLRRIFRESGRVMITFCIASAATVTGAVVGYFLLDLGDIGAKVAGVYTGGWIGGAVNFLAVSQAVEMSPQEFSESISASSVVSITALTILVTLPSFALLGRFLSPGNTAGPGPVPGDHGAASPPLLRLTHVCAALAISFAICAVSKAFAEYLSVPGYSILFITLLSIVLANLAPGACARLSGEFEIGMLLMYLFFAAVGAGTDATTFIASALNLFVYGMLIITLHLAIVIISARVLRISLPEAIVASGAALVGPAPTAAIAVSRGWTELITPGIMCGIFGYVIGTFIGVWVTSILS